MNRGALVKLTNGAAFDYRVSSISVDDGGLYLNCIDGSMIMFAPGQWIYVRLEPEEEETE